MDKGYLDFSTLVVGSPQDTGGKVTTNTLGLIDRLFYKIAEPLYTVKYHCINCNHDMNVKGAMPRRIYFCPDCNMQLFKEKE